MTKKEKNKIFIICLIVSFIIGGIFFRVVYSLDAYTIKCMGLDFYNNFIFGNMRPIQYLITKGVMYIFGSNIEYEIIYSVYLAISLVLLAISIYLVYTYIIKLIKNNEKIKELSKLKKVLIFLCLIFMFFNRYLSDNLIYLENFTMILALFLAVVASIVYSKNIKFKNVICLILLIISEFSYQTMITAFVVLSLLFYALKNDNKINMKYIIKITILFIIPLLLLLIFSKIDFDGMKVNDRYVKSGEWLSIIISMCMQIFIYIFKYVLYYLIFSIIFNFVHLKNKSSYVTYNLFCIIILSVIYNYSFGIVNCGVLSNRMAWGIGALAGTIHLYIIIFRNDVEIKSNRYIISIILALVMELVIYFLVYGLYVRYNNTIKENTAYVLNYINEYNEEHEEKIEKVAIYEDKNITESKWGAVLVYLVPSLYNQGSDIFNVHLKIYSNNKIDWVEPDNEIYDKYFKDKDWNEFDLEQFIVENNTLHFCKY